MKQTARLECGYIRNDNKWHLPINQAHTPPIYQFWFYFPRIKLISIDEAITFT